MKLSLKLKEHHHGHHHHHHHRLNAAQNPLLFRAKIPITVLGLPFVSAFSLTDHPSDVSLSLSTNFPAGPSLKLSYTPTTAGKTAGAGAPPLTLTLKSGVSDHGSPNNSPLVISAHFTFSPQSPNPSPRFSLQLKPRLGSFSLFKSISSSPRTNGDVNSLGFVPLEKPVSFKDLTMGLYDKDSILSGILVMANTEMPLTKRLAANLRWGVNFPANLGKELPYLRVNKIGIETVREVKEEKMEKNSVSDLNDLEVIKGLCSLMRREFDVMRYENDEMREILGGMKFGQSMTRNHGYGGGGKLAAPMVENSSGFEPWRTKKNGRDDGGKKDLKNGNSASDVETELQRALKGSSS